MMEEFTSLEEAVVMIIIMVAEMEFHRTGTLVFITVINLITQKIVLIVVINIQKLLLRE